VGTSADFVEEPEAKTNWVLPFGFFGYIQIHCPVSNNKGRSIELESGAASDWSKAGVK